ncbi:non-ribosomal peptide synthetase [Nocardia takedensis]|uniref:non-ribosomal peptide synthetase n=1 Tax=Nocardia takedensis TaxID=259390 RepID=UPI00030B67E6|nr:non-ribosomal peptide synthetase [Nocardia takedensis]
METARRSGRSGRRRRSAAPTFGQLLTAAVESAAESIAVQGVDAALTYRQLDAESSRLARELIEHGVGPGDVVAIAIARSVESVLSVWAIAKTGAAYVPIDPTYPAERIAHMLTDSGARFGLTASADRSVLGTGVYWIELNDPVVADRIANRPEHPVSYTDRVRPLDERHPAYVIYTSGSTGKPKGVVVTHSGLATLVATERERYGITPESRVLHICSPNFDVSVLELMVTFSTGATLVVAPPTVFGGLELSELMRRERVTNMVITPAALESVDSADLPDLASVAVVGDRFGPELVARWDDGARRFYNVYGPTEVTILATGSAPLRKGDLVTIGTAIPGIGTYILDAQLRPVPAGVTGELYLSGAAVTQGYLNRPALTSDRFVANPFGQPGERMYRTGDLVRRVEDGGAIECLGRVDFQVKVRGFRVELGEIDNALTAHPSVDFAATLGKSLPSGQTALVSYVLPQRGHTVDVAELAAAIGESLPAYMIPASIIVLDEIPLTPVGKLDRKALPEPVFATREFRAPSTPTEQVVAEVFGALLFGEGEGAVGADDDFFELGGNSLLAAQASARIGSALDVRLPVQVMFEATTVAALAERIEQQAGTPAGRALHPVARPEHIPLSYAQQRMWFLNRFDPDSAVNNIPVAVRLSGRLDLAALRAAVTDLVGRHEVLRTVYPEVDGVGVQEVLAVEDPAAAPELPVVEATEDRVPALVAETVLGGFDVTATPPFRLRLIRVAPEEHVLVSVVHHIAGDGFSMGPLTRDLMTAYAARAQDAAPGWSDLEVQYADYAIWQRETLGVEEDPESLLRAQIDYWRAELAGLPEQLDLPADRPRPAVASNHGATLRASVDADLHAALREIGARHNATLFMVVHAALAVLLARLSGTRDIAIGTPVAGRGEAALDDLVGMFVNTLVLRTDVDPGAGFGDLLGRVRASDVNAFGHADVPFERLVELLDPARSQARHPLFQVLLVLQNLAPTALTLPGLTASAVEMSVPLAKFDLQLEVVEATGPDGGPGGLSLAFTYATDLFDESTVRALSDRFALVLAAIAGDRPVAVGDIALLDERELHRALRDWNNTAASVDSTGTLVGDFDTRAALTPDLVAVRDPETGETLTYAEFAGRVHRLGRYLVNAGVRPESLVGIGIRRSVDLVVALYAVQAAGGAYVPLDLDQPVERIGYVLETAAPILVLTTTRDGFVRDGFDSVPIDELDLSRYSDAPMTNRDRRAPLRPSNTAYVIFTSGSTGRPKGVAVSHAAIVNRLAWMQSAYRLSESDVVLQKTPATFDVSVWEFFWPLRTGARLVVAKPDGHRDPGYLVDVILDEGVTTAHFVPSMLSVFVAEERSGECTTLRNVFASGEALPAATAQRLRQATGASLHNLYGPTEAAVDVTYHEVTDSDTASVPIGAPVFNTRVYVLDSRLHPVPVGVAGELYLAGVQLARGYVARPDLTADRFVANPFDPAGGRMYRTGDLVTWTADGELEYLGRTDFQVKLRGLRIELGEIESALTGVDAVAQAVVLVRSDDRLGDQLVAYVIPAPGREFDVDAVRTALAGTLPAYMVPNAFVTLDAFPLNASGKLDRKALPAPVFEVKAFRAPSTPTEETVAGVFAEVLGVAQVGLDDDFFELGGNSLIATQVVARLGAALDTRISVRTLFEAPTVGALATRVEADAGANGPRVPLTRVRRPDRVPLSLVQQRMWVLNRLDPGSTAYNIPLVIGLTGALDVSALRYAVADVLERHEALRTRYPADGAGGDPYQQILTVAEALPGGLALESTDDPIARVRELMSDGFDVTTRAPLRAVLLAVTGTAAEPGEAHLLVVVVHHIAGDGVSMAPLARDLATAYVARVEGRSPAWSPLEVQYADFALWQRATIGTESDETSVAAKQLAYWRTHLAGLSGEAGLPLDRPRPPVPSMRGATTTFTLPVEIHEALGGIAREHNATLFMVVHAALAVLLARLSNSADVAVGTAVAGRGERALDDLVGMFVNTLTLRTPVDSGASFAELVETARETDLAAFGHADVPFERVVEEVGAVRTDGQNPLFQVVLAFENTERPTLELPGLTIAGLDAGVVAAKFDLQVSVDPRRAAEGGPGELAVTFNYATDLFDESTATSFARRFARILTAAADDPTVVVGDIDILDAEERDRVLVGSAEPLAGDLGRGAAGAALSQAFAASVEDDPDAPAVAYGAREISYRDLDAASSRLARVLIGLGCGPGEGVSERLDGGVDSVIARWAVLKAGAALVAPGVDAAVTIGVRADAPAVRGNWLAVDDPEVGALIAAQSARPVTYANRVRTLRGADPAVIGPDGHSVSYDEVAAAAERLAARAEITFESRLYGQVHDAVAAELTLTVVAGVQGATLVVGAGELTTLLAEEWVSHVLLDERAAGALDSGDLADLKVVVFEGDPEHAPTFGGSVAVVVLCELFSRAPLPDKLTR